MEQSPFWKARRSSASKKNSLHFMEPKGSLPRSEKPATCPFPEPDRSSSSPPSHFSNILFNIILQPTTGSHLTTKHFSHEERQLRESCRTACCFSNTQFTEPVAMPMPLHRHEHYQEKEYFETAHKVTFDMFTSSACSLFLRFIFPDSESETVIS
jgi:hypothetical protein